MNLFNLNLSLPNFLWPFHKDTRVLVVEDDLAEVDLIRWGADAEAVKIVHCQSTKEAMGVLHQNGRKFTFALIDVKLEGHLNGWALRRIILDKWPDLPVCMMSGSPESFIDSPKGEMVCVMVKAENYASLFRRIKMMAKD